MIYEVTWDAVHLICQSLQRFRNTVISIEILRFGVNSGWPHPSPTHRMGPAFNYAPSANVAWVWINFFFAIHFKTQADQSFLIWMVIKSSKQLALDHQRGSNSPSGKKVRSSWERSCDSYSTGTCISYYCCESRGLLRAVWRYTCESCTGTSMIC